MIKESKLLGEMSGMNYVDKIEGDMAIGFELAMAREEFCGVMNEDHVSHVRMEQVFDDFKKWLIIGFFQEDYSNNLENTGRGVAESIISQIGCLSAIKTVEFKQDDVQEVLDFHLGELDIKEATIATIDYLVRPYMPVLEVA